MRPKFTDRQNDANARPGPHLWGPVYERVQSESGDRIVATVPGSGIDLILKLTEDTPGPYGILYVLVVPRKTTPGRYQLKEWLDRSSFVTYLERYRAYFEGDGRHHIWVNCGDESLVVYDRHETLFLYGDLEEFSGVLDDLGYSAGEVRIDFAHVHSYNEEFDDDELSIVNSDDYIYFDLVRSRDL